MTHISQTILTPTRLQTYKREESPDNFSAQYSWFIIEFLWLLLAPKLDNIAI